ARQGVLRLEQPVQASGYRQQYGISGRNAEPVIDMLEAVDVDDEHGRAYLFLCAGDGDDGLQPVHEKLTVGQAGEIVMYRVMQEPLFGLFLFGHVDHGADAADYFAVGAYDRPRAQREPVVVAVRAAQPEILGHSAPAMLQDDVKRGAEGVAVRSVQEG